MNRAIIMIAIAMLLSAAALAQKQIKPWKEWNKKDAEKILNDSAWSHSQTESNSSQSSDVPSNFGDTRGREDSQRNVPTNSSLTFHIRFFTARPVRQAYVRMLELGNSAPEASAMEKMEAWANLAAADRIIVTVAYEGDQRIVSRIAPTFRAAKVEDLKESVYLERNDGKRVQVAEYTPPAKDVFGARFTFPRTVDGQPFLTPDATTIRFHAEYEPKVLDAAVVTSRQANASRSSDTYKLKLDLKFKVAEMIYNGDLEY